VGSNPTLSASIFPSLVDPKHRLNSRDDCMAFAASRFTHLFALMLQAAPENTGNAGPL